RQPTLAERLAQRVEIDQRLNALKDRIGEIDPDWKPKTPDPVASIRYGSGEENLKLATAQLEEAKSRLAELAQQSPEKLIADYRANASRDLFPRSLSKNDTVATAVFNGQPFFGVNSTAGPRVFSQNDRDAASRTVADLARKYPDDMKTDNLGYKPND